MVFTNLIVFNLQLNLHNALILGSIGVKTCFRYGSVFLGL